MVKVTLQKFGEMGKQEIYAYTIRNEKGMEITCLNYGCIISKIIVPDRNGNLENIVLGFDSLEEYLQYSPYFGAVVGRVAGRIKKAEFELDGQVYTLEKNENNNHLHGGIEGFSHKIWEAKIIEGGVEFSRLSPDGEEGYPGNLEVKVKYLLNNQNEFTISYEGNSDRKTLLNLTNHTYFNLSGNAKRDILDHSLTMKSSEFLELNEELLPTGNILSADNSSFDFRKGRKIRDGVTADDPQHTIAGGGYDHPFILEGERKVSLVDDESGRKVRIETDQPSVVVYSGNQLTGDFTIWGVPARKYLGICLETQGLPDAIHHPHFPSCILHTDEKCQSTTKYIFETC